MRQKRLKNRLAAVPLMAVAAIYLFALACIFKIETNGSFAFTFAENFIHLSFDDVEKSFKNLNNNNFASLSEEPFFGMLFNLNAYYDIKVSLYVYGDALDDFTDKYQSEFFEARDWLKIGYHAPSSDKNLKNYSRSDAKAEYQKFIDNVMRIAGTLEIVDNMPRLQSFQGSEQALLGMKDSSGGGLKGFLSSDDSRNSYYLSRLTNSLIFSSDKNFYDKQTELYFVKTDIRLDWFNSEFKIEYDYQKPQYSDVYSELNYRFCEKTEIDKAIIVFAHEWDIYDGINVKPEKLSQIKEVCRFATENDIKFSFPEKMLNKKAIN